MYFFVVTFSLFFIFVFFLLMFMFFFMNKVNLDKSSPFECGFQPFSNYSVSFSMPFFVISLMFLLFDVEIVLLSFPPFVGDFFLSFWLVLLFVFLATCYEWMEGVFCWLFSFL